jgi:hypothetical protein
VWVLIRSVSLVPYSLTLRVLRQPDLYHTPAPKLPTRWGAACLSLSPMKNSLRTKWGLCRRDLATTYCSCFSLLGSGLACSMWRRREFRMETQRGMHSCADRTLYTITLFALQYLALSSVIPNPPTSTSHHYITALRHHYITASLRKG